MRTTNLIVICITLIIAGVIFWPTLYRYDRITIRNNSLPLRINRLTGYTEHFVLGEWVPEKSQEKKNKNSGIPSEEIVKITGNASLSDGYFSGKLYNGSSWTISDITFRIIAKKKDGTIKWNRDFNKSIRIDPLTTSLFSITVIGDEGIDNFDWLITKAFGFKANK